TQEVPGSLADRVEHIAEELFELLLVCHLEKLRSEFHLLHLTERALKLRGYLGTLQFAAFVLAAFVLTAFEFAGFVLTERLLLKLRSSDVVHPSLLHSRGGAALPGEPSISLSMQPTSSLSSALHVPCHGRRLASSRVSALDEAKYPSHLGGSGLP